MRWAGVTRPSGGASACVRTPRWDCEQAAPCPAPSAGLSPGPSPISPPPHPLPLTDGGACSPMEASVWAALWQRFQPFRSLAASGGGGGAGAGATPIPNPLASTWTWGKNAPTVTLHTHDQILPPPPPRAAWSPLQRVKSLFIHCFYLFVSSAAGKRQCGSSRNVIQGVGKRTGSWLLR